MRGPLAACVALFLAGGVAAQQPTFRTSARLIEVSVVVEDSSGRPVEGLSRDDFMLYEDDQEQAIAIFAPPPAPAAAATTVANAASRDVASALPSPLGRSDFSNRSAAATAGVTVIVIDRLNTRFEDQRHVRDDVLKALSQIRRDDRVAVYVLESDVVRVLHDFTTDTASLARALSRYSARTSRQAQASAETPIAFAASGNAAEDAAFDAWLRESTKEVADHYIRDRVESTTAALKAIAARLAGVRGRKNLVWLSSGFPLVIEGRSGPESMAWSLDPATRAINNANIAVYAMFARGLVAPYAGAARKPTEEVNRYAPRNLEADAALAGLSTPSSPPTQSDTDTLESIADATGGRAFVHTNDAGKAIGRAIEDSRLTYVLGYYPGHGGWDGAFHTIRVRVNRRGVNARSRKGYFATPPAVGTQPAEALLDALRNPLESTEIGVSAHLEQAKSAAGQAGREYAVEIQVEPAALTIDKRGDIWNGSIDLLIGESLPEGRYFKTFAANIALEFTEEQHAQLLRDGLHVSRTVATRAGAHRLHIVVRDAPSGATGSLIIPLQPRR